MLNGRIGGADGYRGRWVLVTKADDGGTAIEIVDSFDEMLQRDLNVLVVDVPIGLLSFGARECDRLIRRLIGPRRNSVFTAPIRPMLAARSWEEACSLRYAVEGKRCSKQTFGIMPLIRSVDSIITPQLQDWIREGHPEASFALMRGSPMPEHKSKPGGITERMAAVRRHFADIDRRIAEFDRRGALTDVLDAYAMLWTASRIQSKVAVTYPGQPQWDPHGLRVEIVV